MRKALENVAAECRAATMPGLKPSPKEFISKDDYPVEWHSIAVEMAMADRPVKEFEHRWEAMARDARKLLDRWGNAAHRLGWNTLDLFGVDHRGPATNPDLMGLVPFLNGCEVIGLSARMASYLAPDGNGSVLRIFTRVDVSRAVPLTKLMPQPAYRWKRGPA
jgi:hypothetical protein